MAQNGFRRSQHKAALGTKPEILSTTICLCKLQILPVPPGVQKLTIFRH